MEFAREVVIAARPDAVFDVLVDIESWPQWTKSMTSLEPLTPGDLAVGSRVRIRQPYMGARTWVVTELIRPSRFTWESTQAGVHLVARHDQTAQGRSTVARLGVSIGGPIGALVAPLAAARTRRFLELEANGLAARSLDSGFRAPDLPPARTRDRPTFGRRRDTSK